MGGRASSSCPGDDQLVAWIEERLSPKAKAELTSHFDECSACSDVLAHYAKTWTLPTATGLDSSSKGMDLPAPDPEPGFRLEAGLVLERYVLLHPVGSGGMGEVYAAYDTKLDRKVALKLLRRDPDQRARERLVREARAMAKVTHPNVMTVYEAGTAAGRNFVAMEFVEGTPLDVWLRGKRSAADILAVFRQAGRGLAAAHSAQLIHRDFKPANVLLGEDGRARVTDFGLARPEGHEPGAVGDSGDPTTGTPLTRTGAALGTPAYMAPEQYDGRGVSARSDQFSFCVALYEALYGERPFSGETARKIHMRIVKGDIDPPPPDARVPSWLRKVLLRGLQAAAEARYPSMEALLAALDKDPAIAQRRRLWQAGVAGGMAALASLAIFAFARENTLCQAAHQELAGVWDKEVKEAIKAAFVATGRPYAQDTFDRVERLIDHRAATWVAMRTETCEATHVRGEQSEKLLDLRMQCLDRRRKELGAMTALFVEKADGEVIDKAVEALSKLRSLRRCADTEVLQAAYPPPDALTRDKVEQVQKRIDAADALEKAGKYREGLEILTEVADEAKELDYPPLRAQERFLRGRFLQKAGDAKGAESLFYQAARAAATARDTEGVAKAWTELVWVVGYQQTRYREAIAIRPFAETAIAQAGDEALLSARLLNRLAVVEWSQGKYAEARRICERALAIKEKVLGPDHPDVARALGNLGIVLTQQGEYAAARRHCERALAIWENALGPGHPDVARSLNNLGIVFREQGNYENAQQYYERALAIWENALGLDHPDVADALGNLGAVLIDQGRYREARQHSRRALAIHEKAHGPDHPAVAISLHNIGDTLYHEGQYDEAESYQKRALALNERRLGADHPSVAYPLTTMGKIRLARGQPAAAVAPLERALVIRERATVSGVDLADTLFPLARALWDAGRDRSRAMVLARQARDLYASLGQGRKKELVQVERWLARRLAARGREPRL